MIQKPMMRIKLTVAYDGTNYNGWQIQPNGTTIEEILNRELSRLLGEAIVVKGASRTDAGVHSLGNIAYFDTETRMPADRIAYALNRSLPPDITAQKSEQKEEGWNPHLVKSRKTYEYRILNSEMPVPTLRLYTHHYHYPLDEAKMDEAIRMLCGEHNFQGFASIHASVTDYTRTVYEASVKREGSLIRIRITGNGFLYHMVRIIAGTLIEIGGGLRQPEEIRTILESKDRSLAGPTAPAKGLTMISWEEEQLEI